MEAPVVPLSSQNNNNAGRRWNGFQFEEVAASPVAASPGAVPSGSAPISSPPSSYQSAVSYSAASTIYHAIGHIHDEEHTVLPGLDGSERQQQHQRQVQNPVRRNSGRTSEDQPAPIKSPEPDIPEDAPPNARRNDTPYDEPRGDVAFHSDLEKIEEHDSYAPSTVSQHSENTIPTAVTPSDSSTNMPGFFGSAMFQTVLHNPTTAHQLLLFSQRRLCGENMEFLEKVNRYRSLIDEMTQLMCEIHRDYITVNAPRQINIAASLLISTNRNLKHTITSMLPKMESIFGDAQRDIERLVASGVYPSFVRHKMSISAAKALAGDRSKYAGLGDCFVLTSPSKADNPIVYASDGFVKVTGYTRKEIIPRNCRFLQGRHTEPASVKRIKKSIDDRKESVELLLNYKKNGEPFWNLLYVSPLCDENGKVVFFLGGQINCSTTIHNASDVLRILSASEDVEDPEESGLVPPATAKESKTSSFLKAFRPGSQQSTVLRQAGMEQGLLNQLGNMDLDKQMMAFYSAYSRYLVINYSTFFIMFQSAGVSDLLYPYKPQAAAQVIGTDVFRFLKYHSPNESARGYKDKVKAALKMGQAISVELRLCARRYMGFEKFAAHWTPLKDEYGEVVFVVLTLGSQRP